MPRCSASRRGLRLSRLPTSTPGSRPSVPSESRCSPEAGAELSSARTLWGTARSTPSTKIGSLQVLSHLLGGAEPVEQVVRVVDAVFDGRSGEVLQTLAAAAVPLPTQPRHAAQP